ncbi:MAG TPA: C40 family peptidase [Pyrinomonadaceae bacterium]|nr:C40 family peptidase [Pyrinomonadaceae bacterium]
MSLSKVFPRLFAVCLVVGLFTLTTQAQQTTTRPRQVSQPTTTTTTETNGRTKLENDLVVVSTDETESDEPEESVGGFASPSSMGQVERLMLAAIQERIGTPYRMGATGPNRYDCSGLVWSVFQQAGVGFERSSARTLWQEYAAPTESERFKFGTLVFFNNLHHVGIVVDENGFFHASSSRGVVYSRFGDYWTKRITGFRRIPLAQGQALIASVGK